MPWLGKYKRFWVAYKDSVSSARSSYSQYREDIFLWETLSQYDLSHSVYVDVGANHPTDISNTYLMYRKGLTGYVVEPNEELINLFRRFRKKDVPLAIGCSNRSAILPFHISRTPVISSFAGDRPGDLLKTVYVPVMPLDEALSAFDITYINLLSIDVEGLNFEVMQGARETIKRSLLVCIEFDREEEIPVFNDFMGAGFTLLKTIHCNLIYLNRDLAAKKGKSSRG